MKISHRARLSRDATGFDQEAIATLILSGRYLGFLPDHCAEPFERRGELRPVLPKRFRHTGRFVSLLRRFPQPSRATQLFAECIEMAHATRR